MKKHYIMLLLLCVCTAMTAQTNIDQHHHEEDSTDVFFRHLKLNELVVTGVTGDTKLKNATAPISIIRPQELRDEQYPFTRLFGKKVNTLVFPNLTSAQSKRHNRV